jgi:hypothetical protein
MENQIGEVISPVICAPNLKICPQAKYRKRSEISRGKIGHVEGGIFQVSDIIAQKIDV